MGRSNLLLFHILMKFIVFLLKIMHNKMEIGVKYHLKKLKNKGLIEHVGASRGGYWVVK